MDGVDSSGKDEEFINEENTDTVRDDSNDENEEHDDHRTSLKSNVPETPTRVDSTRTSSRRQSSRKRKKAEKRRYDHLKKALDGLTNGVMVTCTHTVVNICWQDGSISKDVDSRTLIPLEDVLDDDFW